MSVMENQYVASTKLIEDFHAGSPGSVDAKPEGGGKSSGLVPAGGSSPEICGVRVATS